MAPLTGHWTAVLASTSGSRRSDHRLLPLCLSPAAAARNETKCATKTGHSELRFTLLLTRWSFFSTLWWFKHVAAGFCTWTAVVKRKKKKKRNPLIPEYNKAAWTVSKNGASWLISLLRKYLNPISVSINLPAYQPSERGAWGHRYASWVFFIFFFTWQPWGPVRSAPPLHRVLQESEGIFIFFLLLNMKLQPRKSNRLSRWRRRWQFSKSLLMVWLESAEKGEK